MPTIIGAPITTPRGTNRNCAQLLEWMHELRNIWQNTHIIKNSVIQY
jgi:hypothetical protein